MRAKITYLDSKYKEHELEIEIIDFRATRDILCFHYADGEYRTLLRDQVVNVVITE